MDERKLEALGRLLQQMAGRMEENQSEGNGMSLNEEARLDLAGEAARSLLNDHHIFEPLQLVQWKPYLKNRKTGGPFVVVEVLDKPRVSTVDESGSSYFKEPLDIILGYVDTDGDFLTFHYDSRRFEPFKG